MAFTFSLLPAAEKEYLEAYLWYEKQREGLGEQFANAVRKRLHEIVHSPELYGEKRKHFKETLLNRTFPFVIVFFLDKKGTEIVICSIFHTRRSPVKKYRKK